MSFVLDALKRSEQDRHQSKIPSLNGHQDLMHLSRKQKPLWPYLLTAVLLLNAGVFLYLHFDQRSEIQPAFQPKDVPSQPGLDLSDSFSKDITENTGLPRGTNDRYSASMPPVSQEHFHHTRTQTGSEPIVKLVDEPEIDWAAKEAEAKRLIEASLNQNHSQKPPTVASGSVASPIEYEVIRPKKTPVGGALPFPFSPEASVAESSQERIDESSLNIAQQQTTIGLENTSDRSLGTGSLDEFGSAQADPYEDVPYLFEMASQSRPRVPPLKFNSHIYSDSPSARRVMINNIYLREGQVVNGLEVLEIGETDIVFSKDQQRFKLPAMRDWNG